MRKSVREKLYARLSTLDRVEFNELFQHLDKECALLSAIFNLLKEAVLLVNGDGEIDFCNESAVQLLGLPKTYKQIAPLWHWMPALKHFFEASNSKTQPDVVSKETQLIYPENKWVRIHIQTFPEMGEKHRFIVLLYDITEEKQITEERLNQERVDSVVRLASEVAHELGNPLNSIGIHLQLVQRALKRVDVSENLTRSLKVCQNEVKRLDEIVQHFLQAVCPKKAVLTKADIQPVVKGVFDVLKPQLDNLSIRLEINFQKNLSPIFLDPSRLHQAFFNVVKNAIEAIGSNGWIRVSCYQNDCFLVVAFADSGSGISGAQAAKMLSINNETTKTTGHGIGMLIIRRVMQEHHGFVEIESKAQMGSILYLKFPLPEQSLRKLEQGKSL